MNNPADLWPDEDEFESDIDDFRNGRSPSRVDYTKDRSERPTKPPVRLRTYTVIYLALLLGSCFFVLEDSIRGSADGSLMRQLPSGIEDRMHAMATDRLCTSTYIDNVHRSTGITDIVNNPVFCDDSRATYRIYFGEPDGPSCDSAGRCLETLFQVDQCFAAEPRSSGWLVHPTVYACDVSFKSQELHLSRVVELPVSGVECSKGRFTWVREGVGRCIEILS